MAHKTLINGAAYEVTGGTTLVDGTKRTIKGGRTLVNGTGYDVPFIKGFTVTLKAGNGEQSGWGYGFTSSDSYKANMHIKYSIDGGVTWVELPENKQSTNTVLATLSEVSSIVFKCLVSDGRTWCAGVGKTTKTYEYAKVATKGVEVTSAEIPVTQDTTFYLSLWASSVF